MQPKFEAGLVLITSGAVNALQKAAGADYLRYAAELVARHQRGDWGTIEDGRRQANERAIEYGFRIHSRYDLPQGSGHIWVVTEADRSTTTLLLPEEY